MIKVFTKEKISEVIITHLFTREEINQYFDGNVFIDHPELNPQDYIVLDENNDFTHPTYDEELQAIREMTYEETQLLEVEPLIDGEYIEDGKLIIVEYDEKLGYLKKAWNKETHIWYEGATEDELKTEYFRLINLYKATVFPGPYKWTDKLGEVHYQHSRPDKDVGLLETTISYLERHPEDIMLFIIDVGDIFINKVVWFIGSIVSLIFLITGGEDKMMNCLIILMTIDYLTGVAKAIIIEKVNSKAGFKGLLKKMVMIGVVVLAHQIDLLFEGKFAVKSLTIGILLSNEGLSILENASICGVPIPEKLKNILEQYKERKK